MKSSHYVHDTSMSLQKIENPTENSHISKRPFSDIIYHKRHLHSFYAARETKEFLPFEITQKYRLGGLVSMTTVRGVANRLVFIAALYKASMTLDACTALLPVKEKPAAVLHVPSNVTFNSKSTFYDVSHECDAHISIEARDFRCRNRLTASVSCVRYFIFPEYSQLTFRSL